jgi:uncharacterized phage protein gp47/JayE
MSDTNYIAFPLETSDDVLAADALDRLILAIPGWQPSESHLEVQLIEVLARMNSITASVAASVPPEIFRYFGKSLLQIQSIDAAAATVPTTWTLSDSLGHTISAGTYVYYRVDGDTQIPFQVLSDVVVAPGDSVTTAGEVILQAVNTGTEANGLPSATMYLIDSLSWVTSIVSTATTAGGVDAESDDEYLSRLNGELKLLSPRPIHPDDFAVLARRIAGVGRSVAIDGYNPDDSTFNNERTVTVAVAAEDGTTLDSGTKDEVEAYLESLREINFDVFVIDPTYTTVNVTAQVKMFAGQDSATVQALCLAALATYLSPSGWDWSSTVYRNELIALLSNVTGVDRVVSVTIPASDVSLSGVAALPINGTFSVSVI